MLSKVRIGAYFIGTPVKTACTQAEALFNPNGLDHEICNVDDTVTIFISNITGVTASTGYPLYPGEKLKVRNPIYAICDTGLTADLWALPLM